MMKVSDPVMFGNVVRVFYKVPVRLFTQFLNAISKDVFDKHKDTFDKVLWSIKECFI